MKPSVHQVTLLRSNPVSPPGERMLRVERIAALPVTASSDTRVDAGVRRIANDLTQEHPHLAWQEVVAHVVDSRAGHSTSPAVLVADRSFPIAICLYADAATIVIDLEADDVSVNRRFRLIRKYVASLVH